jgi:hypothetical protein
MMAVCPLAVGIAVLVLHAGEGTSLADAGFVCAMYDAKRQAVNSAHIVVVFNLNFFILLIHFETLECVTVAFIRL